MNPDPHTNITTTEEMTTLLEDLERDGHAERVTVPNGEVWRMTKDGFDLLNGSIADEPPPGAEVLGPAMIGSVGAATPIEPTQIGDKTNAVDTSA